MPRSSRGDRVGERQREVDDLRERDGRRRWILQRAPLDELKAMKSAHRLADLEDLRDCWGG